MRDRVPRRARRNPRSVPPGPSPRRFRAATLIRRCTSPEARTPHLRRSSLLFCAIAAAYAIGSQLSASWFGADGQTASFFPAAGVTLAALILLPRARWPVVIAAAFFAEVTVDLINGIALVPSLGYGVANTVQPLVAAALLARLRPALDIGRTRDLAAFLVAGVGLGPLVGGILGASTFVVLDGGDRFARFAGEWWIGDGLGVLVVGGAILGFRSAAAGTVTRRRLAETAGLVLVAGLATAGVFWLGVIGLAYVTLMALLASGFRGGTRGAALAGAAVAFISAQAVASGHGYLDVLGVSPADGLLYVQLAIAVFLATALAVAAEVAERERSAGERRAAERFRVMADHAPAMLWVTDRNGRCTYLSRGWSDFTGQREDRGLGDGWLEVVDPRDAERVRMTHEWATDSREPFTLDYRLRRADGEYRRVIDAGRPLHGPDGDWAGFIGSVIDVHERSEAEDALRTSDARFKALFESIDEGYCLAEIILDGDGTPVDYRFLEANHLFGAMTGLHDAVGRRVRDLVPDLEDHWVQTYARVALDGQTMRFENGSDAMGRWFDVFATPVEPHGRFALVFKDVTQRRLAEIGLRESELEQRRARRRAELLTEVIGELEAVDGVAGRAGRLAELLVPRVADAATITLAGPDPEVLARAPGPASAPEPHSRALAALETGDRHETLLELALTDPERRPYTDADRAFFADLAARAGLLIASARVHEEEHRVALALQRALLPTVVQVDPAVDVAARYAPAAGTLEVGGDWYDTFRLPDGRLGLAVGDVVGHGLESAATMGRMRTALAALAPHSDGPGDLLSRLQQFTDGPSGTGFATACYAVLDPATGVLQHASAGHPPCLVVAPDGATRWLEDGRSVPLCPLGRPGRPQATTVLESGALLIMFTDGLVERRGESLAMGMDRLEAVARELRDAPVEDVCDAVLAEMVGGRHRADDVVLVCIRFVPVPAAAFRLDFPAVPEELRHVRTAARSWLSARGVQEPHRTRLLVGLGEACSNAVLHGHRDGNGLVHLEVADDGGRFSALVSDGGTWRTPRADDAGGGYGLRVMRGLGDEVIVSSGEDGTTVRFKMAVPAPTA